MDRLRNSVYIVSFILSVVSCAADDVNLYIIRSNDLFGFIDNRGTVIIQPQYSNAAPFSEDLASVEQNGLWGYIDKKGDYVIEPTYKAARPFSEGMAIVKMPDNSVNFIDHTGNPLTETYFDGAMDFQSGYAFVFRDMKLGLMNRQGVMVTGFVFDHSLLTGWGIGPDTVRYLPYGFREGRVPVCINDKYGYIDTNGSTITEPVFEYVDYFRNGLARVQVSGRYGIINLSGTYVVSPQYDGIEVIIDSCIAVEQNGKYGFLDREGQVIIPLQFDYAESFRAGLGLIAATDTDGDLKYGFVNQFGDEVIAPVYDRAYTFDDDGYAIVEDGDESGIIDTNGSKVLPLTTGIRFDSLEGYTVADVEYYHDYVKDGIVIYSDMASGKKGFMDVDGRRLTEPLFTNASHFKNGVARVTIGSSYYTQRVGYVNTSGEYIWVPSR